MGDDIERLERYEDLYEAQCSVDGAHSELDKIAKLEADKAELIDALSNYVKAINNGSIGVIGRCYKPSVELLERME